MDLIIDKTRIPRREWVWNETEIGYEGVNSFDGKLKWFTFRNALNGNLIAAEQRFEDYIKDGPLKENTPPDVMLEIYDLIMGAVE
jgi:hypothetical protein